jgi:hypothetical protein
MKNSPRPIEDEASFSYQGYRMQSEKLYRLKKEAI